MVNPRYVFNDRKNRIITATPAFRQKFSERYVKSLPEIVCPKCKLLDGKNKGEWVITKNKRDNLIPSHEFFHKKIRFSVLHGDDKK